MSRGRPAPSPASVRGLRLSLSKPYLARRALADPAPARGGAHPARSPTPSTRCLDRSPAADQMVGDARLRLVGDVAARPPRPARQLPARSPRGCCRRRASAGRSCPGLRGIGATAFSLALLAIVLHAFALGGVLGALREPSSSLVTFGREGMRRLPAFLLFTLAAFAAALRRPTAGSTSRSGEALRDRVEELHDRAAGARRDGAAAAGARCSRSRSSSCSPTRSARSGSRGRTCLRSRASSSASAARSRGPCASSASSALYALLTAGLYLLWLVLDPSAGGEARFALVPLILTQQVFVFVRLLIKVGYYAGDLGGAHADAVARVLLRRRGAAEPVRRQRSADAADDEPRSTSRPAPVEAHAVDEGLAAERPRSGPAPTGPVNHGRKRRSCDDDVVPPSGAGVHRLERKAREREVDLRRPAAPGPPRAPARRAASGSRGSARARAAGRSPRGSARISRPAPGRLRVSDARARTGRCRRTPRGRSPPCSDRPSQRNGDRNCGRTATLRAGGRRGPSRFQTARARACSDGAEGDVEREQRRRRPRRSGARGRGRRSEQRRRRRARRSR